MATAPTQYRNVSAIDNYGFNAGYEATLGGRFRYGLNGTGAIARRVDAGTADSPLVVAPQLFGNARIAYDLGEKLPTVALAAYYQGRRPADRAFDFSPSVYAPALVEMRLTLTGAVPGLKGLTYRASANYAFAEKGPYVIGPTQSQFTSANIDANAGGLQYLNRPAELIPIDRFRGAVGLQYDF
jgi:hypothetical protein